MKIIFFRRHSLQRVVMLSIAMVVLNFLSLQYLAQEDIESADMSILAGHRIIIDPGHGGIDSGASANNVIEKRITFDISNKLGNILQESGAIVTFTRDGDIDYYTKGKGGKRNDLLQRIKIIEESGAEIFISIHCNAFRGANLSGAQVFYSPNFAENKQLAERLQQALKNFPPNNKRQAKEDLHILVLNGTTIPGVLVETGYITNQEEALLLVDDQYQQKLAEQMGKGLAYYFSKNVTK